MGERISKQESAKRIAQGNVYIFTFSGQYDIDGQVLRNTARYINHSCDPNVYVATIDGKRVVIGLYDISAGEEIAYDYCINGGGDTLWTCHCGAGRCRQTIHSDFFHLPDELQVEYLPLLDTWFQEERRTDIQQLRKRLNVI